jgi:DNA-binding transcriptional MerR regulator
MPGEGKTVVRARARHNDAASEELRQLAYKLRLQGMALREITEYLPVNPATQRPYSHIAVRSWIKELIEQERAPVREELREMEGQRLDVYMQSLHAKYELAAAKGRDADAQRWMALLLDVQQRRARLFGLDAPVVIDTHVTTTQVEDTELAARVEEARQAAQAARQAASGEG